MLMWMEMAARRSNIWAMVQVVQVAGFRALRRTLALLGINADDTRLAGCILKPATAMFGSDSVSNVAVSSLDQMKGQDLLSRLLRNLAEIPSGLLQETANVGASDDNQDEIIGMMQKESVDQHMMQVASNTTQEPLNVNSDERINSRNIDLNRVCDNDVKGIVESSERCDACEGSKSNHRHNMMEGQQDLLESSPSQLSTPSNSSSGHSPSSSSGEDQCRTDRIVLKLFGKDPNDLPIVLRSLIIQWLSNSPTEMESYIKPGCIVLTIDLRLRESMWEEPCHNLGSSLSNLRGLSSDHFWRSGWIYMRVQDFASYL